MANGSDRILTPKGAGAALISVTSATGIAGVAGVALASLGISWLTYPAMALGFIVACIALVQLSLKSATSIPSGVAYIVLMISSACFVAGCSLDSSVIDEMDSGGLWAFPVCGLIFLPGMYIHIVIVRRRAIRQARETASE